MRIYTRLLLFTLLSLCFSNATFSQDTPLRQDKFYTMSGFGFSIPVGASAGFMRPKFSTTIGTNIGLGSGHLFLYPKLSLHVFGYDNSLLGKDSNYELEKGRSTTYLLSAALGYRRILGNFAFYGFVGAGGGFVLTPRISVNQATNIASLNNKTNHLGTIEPGAGMEYNIGGANLFIESSYMYGIGDIGDRPFNAIPITIGIKPNLSKLFAKKKR